MQYILELLLPCIVILYLIDCVVYVKRDHFLFFAHFGSRFTFKRPGIHLVGILPTAKSVVLHNIQVYFSTKAIHISKDDSLSNSLISEINFYTSVKYKEIEEVHSDGKDVVINGEKLIKTQSPIIARQFSDVIKNLIVSDPSERNKQIRLFLESKIDLEKIRSIKTSHLKLFFWLEIVCILLFVFSFVELPILIYFDLFSFFNIYILLIYIAILYFLVLVLSIFGERAIYQDRRKGSFALLSLVLSPVSALHAISNFTRDLYAEFDYLAVAAELLPKNIFMDLTGRELARVSNSREMARNSDLEEYFVAREECLHGLLGEVGVPVGEILTDPQKRDISAETYCPVCKAEYRSGFTSCSDCGVRLKAYYKG